MIIVTRVLLTLSETREDTLPLCTFETIPPRRTSAAASNHQKLAEIFSSDDPPRVRLVSVKQNNNNNTTTITTTTTNTNNNTNSNSNTS